jgi:hypothetical protein
MGWHWQAQREVDSGRTGWGVPAGRPMDLRAEFALVRRCRAWRTRNAGVDPWSWSCCFAAARVGWVAKRPGNAGRNTTTGADARRRDMLLFFCGANSVAIMAVVAWWAFDLLFIWATLFFS